MKQNKPQKAMEHYHAANALDDSIKRITTTEAVAKINSLYNYQRTEQTNIQLQLSQEKQTRAIWVLSFFLLLSLSIGIIIYFHIQKKHQTLLSKEQTLLKQAEDNYANSIEQVKENRQEIDRLNSLLKENEDKSKLLEKELALAKKLQLESQNAFIIASQKEKELSEQAFMESEIYSLFHKAAFTPGLHLSAKEWSILHRHFHEAYPNFLSKLKELYPNPSEHELRICLLLKMGITLTGIANLLESSKPSITNARARLYERIFGKKGKASDLDKFIAEL
jgi:Rad3-related DNA helicase